jgi:hypothetical protein
MFSNVCIPMQIDSSGRMNMEKVMDSFSKLCGVKDQSILDKISTTCGYSGEGKISFRF